MAIFGLSSLDALISLALIETAWWTTKFFLYILPMCLYYYRRDIWRDVSTIIIGITLESLLKCLAPGLLWLAFFWNSAKDPARLLLTWFWIGLALDLVTGARVLLTSLGHGSYLIIIILLLPYILVRAEIWITARRLISDLYNQDKAFFPSGFLAYVTDLGCRTLLVIVLIWEVGWYGVSSVGFILSLVVSKHHVLLPMPAEDPMEDSSIFHILYLVTVPVALVQLLAVTKGGNRWKIFLKFWLPVYILFNILGYVLVTFNELIQAYFEANYLALILIFGINTGLSTCALGLKLSVVIVSIKGFAKNTDTDDTGDELKLKPETEFQPLIGSDSKKGSG